MKLATLFTALIALSLTACDKKPEEPFVPTPSNLPSATFPAGHPLVNTDADDPTLAPSDGPEIIQTQQATVLSSIDIPQFTYLEVKQDNQTRWLAAPTITVKKGDAIRFDNGSTMNDFDSKALNRTFASITFVNRVTIEKNK
ncbi:MAG: hypothetical protein WAW75_01880 [Gallionella sp.]